MLSHPELKFDKLLFVGGFGGCVPNKGHGPNGTRLKGREDDRKNNDSHCSPYGDLRQQCNDCRQAAEGLHPGRAAEEEYADAVGLFEGAGYAEKGMCRSCLHCVIGAGGLPYCKACQDAIKKVIEHHSN